MRYKRIHDFSIGVLKPIIEHLKKIKKTNRMPWKEFEAILKILYRETKHEKRKSGYFKNVFVIHNNNRWFVLKVGRDPAHIKKDMKTYKDLLKSWPSKSINRNYAKIYWATDIFMLQKWGEEAEVPPEELKRLKKWGKEHGLKDIRPANIMKVDGLFKIVDAEKI